MSRAALQKKFRNKILQFLLVSMLLPMTVWGFLAYRGSLHDHTTLFEHQLNQAAEIVKLQAERWASGNHSLLTFLANGISAHSSRHEWPALLRRAMRSEPAIFMASVSDASGRNVARSDDKPMQNDGDREYFQRALQGEFHSEAIVGNPGERPYLCSAAPVFSGSRVVLVVTLCSFLDQLSESLGTLHIGKTGHVLLIDERGRVLADPDAKIPFQTPSFTEKALIDKALVSMPGRMVLRDDAQDSIAYVYPLVNGWRALAVQSRKEILSLSKETLAWPFTVGLGMLLLLMVLTYSFVDQITTPLHRLADVVRRFGQGDLGARAIVESEDELGLLATNFNLMANQIRATIQELKDKEQLLAKHRDELHQKVTEQSQKLLYSAKMSSLGEMAGGIAHEINNPLAIISLKAQRIHDSFEYGRVRPQEIMDLADQIEKTCLRINKIIRGLRTFSRDGSRDPMVEESLSSTLMEAANLCAESLRVRGIELHVNCPPDIQLRCQPVQISQVFLNMIMNARDAVSNLSEKWIRIDCSQDLTLSRVLIKITDSGPGVGEPIRSQMMRPFFTTKAVGEGTGLGLSISKGIVEHHQGTLIYNADSEHTQFLISLPLGELNRSPWPTPPAEPPPRSA